MAVAIMPASCSRNRRSADPKLWMSPTIVFDAMGRNGSFRAFSGTMRPANATGQALPAKEAPASIPACTAVLAGRWLSAFNDTAFRQTDLKSLCERSSQSSASKALNRWASVGAMLGKVARSFRRGQKGRRIFQGVSAGNRQFSRRRFGGSARFFGWKSLDFSFSGLLWSAASRAGANIMPTRRARLDRDVPRLPDFSRSCSSTLG